MSLHRPPGVDPSRLVLSLDALTDGSERTGHGAIFLSIRKGPKCPAAGAGEDYPLCLESAVDDSDPSHSLLARYAISGLPTLTARLCADQRLHLASTRAAFLPTLDPASIVGMPSLLLALNNAGSAKVFVAGPRGLDAYLGRNVDLVLGRYKAFPVATTCEVPSSSGGAAIGNDSDCWWQVYEDEFIIVHAKYVDLQRAKQKMDDEDDESSDEDGESSSSLPSSSSSEEDSSSSDEEENMAQLRRGTCSNVRKPPSVAYIFTCKGTKVQFAILPPGLDISSPLISASLHPFPEATKRPLSLMVFLSPQIANSNEDEKRKIVCADLTFISRSFVATVPGDDISWDDGILVRASNQARKFHQVLPFAFAANNLSNGNSHIDSHFGVELDCSGKEMSRLRSCTSTVIRHGQRNNSAVNAVVDRRRRIASRIFEKEKASTLRGSSSNGTGGDIAREEQSDVSVDTDIVELASIYGGDSSKEVSTKAATSTDGNEISLDDDDSDDECIADIHELTESCEDTASGASVGTRKDDPRARLDPQRAHLLVLGTGCASPSPLRGSSGYGILLPTWHQKCETGSHQKLSLTGLLECGEGSLTALRRHLPSPNGQSLDDWLRQIRFIWISHAHLDHYSELPLMIRAIADAGGRQAECSCWKVGGRPTTLEGNACFRCPSQSGVSLWCSKCTFPPIVVAPPKVLQFLKASLACSDDRVEEATSDASHSKKRKHERICDKIGNRLYFGVSNQDFDRSPFASTLRQMLFSIELPRSPSSSYRPFISLQSVPVTHCPQAFAVILGLRVSDDNKPFFLVYSGDTRPSQSLVQACQRAVAVGGDGSRIDMLIHETTFDDDEQGKQNAIAKRHSTVMEAVEVARQMDARCCLFTHFSQRYPNLPESASTLAPGPFPRQDKLKLCAAIDGMIIPLRKAADSMPLLNQCCQRLVN
mmetsp:Transcript_6266/g.17525  ORF Transcript_6266/g.17525 Transcript_6266/m.17525 type:complete len:935 (+) Transcript_6266:171-2975(+)